MRHPNENADLLLREFYDPVATARGSDTTLLDGPENSLEILRTAGVVIVSGSVVRP